jgi:hypothetical protein
MRNRIRRTPTLPTVGGKPEVAPAESYRVCFKRTSTHKAIPSNFAMQTATENGLYRTILTITCRAQRRFLRSYVRLDKSSHYRINRFLFIWSGICAIKFHE